MTAASRPSSLPGFFPVRDKARFLVAGTDARRYLNGQLTIDVGRLTPGVARQALILSAKGRLCAPLQVWLHDEEFLLETEAALGEVLLARLERYIISDDVTISEQNSSAPLFHVPDSPAPDGALSICRLGRPGYDATSPPSGFRELTAADVERARLSDGIPLWGAELSDESLPHEARLETAAVDFDKGCYVGQEVVSRLQSVGRVNRRLHGFFGPPAPPSLPCTIVTDEPSPRPAGALTSAAYDFELAQTLSLGYLNRQFEDFPAFLAVDAAGNTVGNLVKRPI